MTVNCNTILTKKQQQQTNKQTNKKAEPSSRSG